MTIKVTSERILDVTVLRLVGRITLGTGSLVFRNAVREALWAGHKKLALDYGSITYQDSSGFGEMVAAFTYTRNAGGELVLFDLGEKMRDALLITKLFTVFQAFDSLDSALSYFNRKRRSDLEVRERRYGVVSVLEVQGTLTEPSGAGKLLDAIDGSLQAGARSIVVLCPQILDIDRSGATIVGEARNRIQARRGALVFADLEGRLISAIDQCGALELFSPRKSLDGALHEFGLAVDHQNWRVEAARAR